MSAQTPGGRSAQGVSRLAFMQTDDVDGTRTISAPPSPKHETNKHAMASPSLQRRSSSQISRPGSSASPRIVRKSSRSSLGGSPAPSDDVKKPTPKRSISNLITELRGAQATMEVIPEPVIMTAPEIATECFQHELAGHEAASVETIVILHDACYGHRYSRLKSSKGTLSMIVERPERILASVLGIATTYVRMGGYHVGGKNAPHPKRMPTTAPPFKIRRTARALDIKSTYVTNVHGHEWMSELHSMCNVAGARLAAQEKEVARLNTSIEARMLHEGDLYLCQESLDAFQGALGGVADAVDSVFSPSTNTARAFVAVRPPGHHCSADYPSGFCWINNVHVGIEYAAQTYDLTHAAIIDFDLHHGDGSQAITWARNSKNNAKRLYPKAYAKTKLSPDIGYYSIHDINSYPCEMGDDEKVQAASLCIHNAHGQSIWNVHLQPWKTLEEFWALYESRYTVLLDKAREFLQYQTTRIAAAGTQRPKAAIFISAGFDASEWEGEGMQRHKVNVPTDFYARFTKDIMKIANEEGTACGGRVISVLEGGYSDRALCSSTISHLSALCAPDVQPTRNGAVSSLGLSMTGLDERLQNLTISSAHTINSDWWSVANLKALELHVNPPPPLTAGGKKIRAGPHPTYATPTESFAYKVIDPAKFARSVSGTMREGSAPTRPVTPPPPEVDWIVAAHELSKLLTPTERTTKSCTADDLAGNKVKKERASSAEQTTSPDELGKPRQLRTRGKMAQTPAQPSKRIVSSDRRRTMADLPSAVADAGPISLQQRRTSRRSSMASTTSNISTLPDKPPPVPALPSQQRVSIDSTALQIKKTRVVPPTPGKPKRSPQKASAQLDRPASTRTTSGSAPTDNSLDNLASGMKRITLTVGSREESERKTKEKLDADRRARALKGAETRRLNKAAKEARAAQEQQHVVGGHDVQQSRSNSSTPHLEPSFASSSGVDAVDHVATTYTAPNPHQSTLMNGNTPSNSGWPTNQQAFPYPAYDGTSETSHATPYQQPVHNEQVQDLYPMPQYQRSGVSAHNLPIFTSTGYIPFASPTPGAQQPESFYHGQENGLHYPIDATHYTQTMDQHDQISGQQSNFDQDGPAMNSYDVWAVPETPSKQLFDPQR